MKYLFEGIELSTNIVLGFELLSSNSSNAKVTAFYVETSHEQEKDDAIALIESLTLNFVFLDSHAPFCIVSEDFVSD